MPQIGPELGSVWQRRGESEGSESRFRRLGDAALVERAPRSPAVLRMPVKVSNAAA
jgi:hypothetical protein